MASLAQRVRINPFLLTLSALTASVYAYLGHGLIAPLELPSPLGYLAWLALLLPFALIFWLPLYYWKLDEPTDRHNPMLWAAFGSMALLSFLLFYVGLRDVAALALGAYAWLRGQTSTALPLALQGARGTAAIAGATIVSLLLGFRGAHRVPSVVEVEVPIDGLPEALNGLRIAQISDLHIGPTIRRPFVERVVAVVNGLRPDLIALTGDLVDGTVLQLASHFEALKALQAPLGRFYVTGNHEYYWEHRAWIEHARASGFTALVNSHAVVERGGAKIAVAGVLDYWAERNGGDTPSDPAAAIAGAPADAALRILLAHQPKSALGAAPLGYHLQLSGHTHGGQFLPWTVAVKGVQPFVAGLYRVGRMWLYVNRGTGYWGPPMRLGSASEITLLRLTKPA